MNETKIKQRFENAFDAFFADENLNECNSLNRANKAELLREESDQPFRSVAFKNLIRQIVFFFPGTFLLYYLCVGFPVLLMIALSKNSTIVFGDVIVYASLLLAGILMTWLGLGDLRKPRHFVIPASIICIGGFSGIIIFLMLVYDFYVNSALGNVTLYIFPLALIVPFLAKGLVDRKSD